MWQDDIFHLEETTHKVFVLFSRPIMVESDIVDRMACSHHVETIIRPSMYIVGIVIF